MNLNFPACLHPPNQDVEMQVLRAEGNALGVGTVIADTGNGSSLRGESRSEWTNGKTTEQFLQKIIL